MAVYLYNNAEGGVHGTTVTTGNSGGISGDALTVSLGTGGTCTYNSGIAHSGNYSIQITPGGTTTCYVTYTFSSSGPLTARAYVYLTAYPSAATQLVSFVNANLVADIALTNTGRFVTQDSAGTQDTSPVGTFLPLNTWVRLELTVIVGTATTNGYVGMSAYTGDTVTSPLYAYSNPALNTTTSPVTFFRVGKGSASGTWSTMYIDDIQVLDQRSIGPVSTLPAAWLG